MQLRIKLHNLPIMDYILYISFWPQRSAEGLTV